MEKELNVIECKNCSNKFVGKFCNSCGQTAETKKIDHRYIFDELKKTFIQFNSGFFHTVKELFFNPGNFIKKYMQGKRVNYTKPFAFLIIACGLNVLLYHYLHVNIIVDEIEGLNKQSSNDFVFEHYVQIQLLILPIYAFVSILFFKQKIYNFFEFIIIHTYLATQRILMNLFIIPLEAYFNASHQIKIILNINMILTYCIMIWAYINLFKDQSKVKIILKTLAIQLITFIILIVLLFLFLKQMH